MLCTAFSSKPTHSLLKIRPSNQSFSTCRTNSPSKPTEDHPSVLQVPLTEMPSTVQKSNKREETAGLEKKFTLIGSPPVILPSDLPETSGHGRLRRSDVCCPHTSNNPAENDARLQMGSDHWLCGQHEPFHCCSMRYQSADRRHGGKSHQAGPDVSCGPEPQPQCLWSCHQQRQPLAGQHPQEETGEACGDSHRGQHIQVCRGQGEHM